MPKGEKYIKIATIKTITILESHTSTAFQLALDAALSALTVVAKVSPFNCSSDGFSVNKLTMIKIAIDTKNKIIQKYKKLSVAKLYAKPVKEVLFNSKMIRSTPIKNPTTMAVNAPFALIRFEKTPNKNTAAIGGAR